MVESTGKNIWVINQFAGTPSSGWGERHHYFAQYWLEAGYRVNIISGSFNHMFNQLPEAPDTYNFKEVEGRSFCWVKTPVYKGQSVMRFWSMLVFAWRILFLPIEKLGKPDHIIVSSMPIFPVLSGYWLKKRWKARHLFFEIRDIWPLTLVHLMEVSKYHPFVLFLGWFEKLGYRKADKIVSLLPNAAKHINAISKDPGKFVYIPNGLSADQLIDEALEEDIVKALPKDKFLIGYTGTFGKANALESLVEAASLLKDHPKIHFVLVGDGYLKEELQEAAKDLPNLTIVRKIRKNQVQSILNYFQACFVGRNNSPLFEHGVSANKYFDYMLAEKPILDANNLIKDPVELSGCGLIVEPESAHAIADGAVKLFEMTEKERLEMGKKGKEYVLNFHGIRHLADSYRTLFESRQ